MGVPGVEHSWLTGQQVDQVYHDELYGVVEASTKSGKTVSHEHWLVSQALQNPVPETMQCWWVAHTYETTKTAFREILRTPSIRPIIADWRETIPPAITFSNGCDLTFRSTDKPNSLYGPAVWAAVMDEASRMDEGARAGHGDEVWAVLESVTTIAREMGGGRIRAIGNVRGRRNWMYKQARAAEKGKVDDWFYGSRTVDDSIRDGFISRDEIDRQHRRAEQRGPLALALFMQDYYNIPIDSISNPFGDQALERAELQDFVWMGNEDEVFDISTRERPAVAFGLDIARIHDYTVCIGLDRDLRVCKAMRTQEDWGEQKILLAEFCEGKPVLMDATGAGDVMLPELQARGVQVEPYIFSYQSRLALIERIRWALIDRPLQIPAGLILSELRSLERTETEKGRIDYQVPSWEHDDCIFALGLGLEHWHQIMDRPTGVITLASLDRHRRRMEASRGVA